MRITSGNARGIVLDSPRGRLTRPATDFARQAIFSSLGDFVCGTSVLDIFAGTGAYGLEALSRGAREAVFVERDRQALTSLKRNADSVLNAIRAAGNEAKIKILPIDSFALPLRFNNELKFDLIFADPPYEMLRNFDTAIKILNLIGNFLSSEGIAVLEAPSEFELFSGKGVLNFELTQIRRLGKKSKGKPTQLLISLKEND